jgi:comEA protein
MIERFKKLGFTGQDFAVILFLLVAFLAGLTIKLSGWKKPAEYNYSVSDSAFENQLKKDFSGLQKNELTPQQTGRISMLGNISDSLSAEKDKQEKENLLAEFGKKINLNTAYSSDLQRLPGIGKVTADKIIEFREQVSRFEKIEDIMKVKGIGTKKFEKIKDLITVED